MGEEQLFLLLSLYSSQKPRSLVIMSDILDHKNCNFITITPCSAQLGQQKY